MSDVVARLALPVRWLIVVGIAYTLATTVLYILSPPVTPAADPAPAQAAAQPRPARDIEEILAQNLFGTADAEAVAAPSDEPARVTQLPLELLGVFVADETEQSAAIISQRGRPGQLYGIGESVPGDATLVEVNANHVVLRRAGVRESLHFPEFSELAARAPAGTDYPPDYPEESYPEEHYDQGYEEYQEGYEMEEYSDGSEGDQASVQDLVEEYRDDIEENPGQALEEMGVEPVTEGAAEGYRIGDLAQSPYLSQTGLQPGDVILSVNGRPVGDLGQDRLELDNVLAQGSARLEVQRGTRRFFVTATLP